ncbi:hypothetical protein VJ918_11600, partial [Adlercreutzia sp. R21]|uniref:hypothetical protein n=1 Tax=Adlercreutzia wanghongyangiae TaxID=3111451 RepID=UPI002DBA6F2C
MVAIDLSKELKTNNEAAGLPDDTPLDNTIESWDLTIGGEHYDYGAPTRFDNGKLYLWLPKSAADKTISVTLEYKNADGSTQKVLPLYREPGQAGDLLKRYLDFQITDQGYLNSLNKYYDGLPLASYDLAAGPITTPPPDNKTLDRVADESGRPLIKYSYQPYDKKPSGPDDDSPRPIGPETSETATDESGNEVTTLPANAGLAKFTMVSKQYADEESSDEDVRDFAKSYWGHRATGWLEIKPVASVVTDLTAEWADEAEGSDQRPGSAEHPADQVLKVSATIDRAKTVDGKAGSEATKPTCAAPEGRVQLYVDGEPVGSPIELLFENKTVPDSPTRASRAVVPANAQRIDNGEGGSYTRFEYSFKPSETDYLVPEVGEVGRHEISLKFLPPSDDQRAEGVPANYLESADPTESPEVPRDTVAIDPIDPNPAVTGGKDPDCTDPSAPEPKVETGPGEPADPGADPDKPGDKVFRGSITTTWGEASEANPHPGRVVLKVRTPSSGAIEVTDEKGGVFKAAFEKGDDGLPVKDGDGCYTLVIDPAAIGTGQLTFTQKPNGAYTGTTWIYSVTVRPDASVAPKPAIAKRAENLTHPEGPTQPGDRVRYTITASNEAAGSLWTQVMVSDPLPACLDVAGATVRLVGADGVERTLSAAAPGAAPAAGQYALSAAGADGRRTLTAPVGDIGGGRKAVLSIECAVRGDIDFAAAAADDLSLENVATAEGKRPNPDDPDGPDVGPVSPEPSDPAAPPGPGEVLPADPDVRVGKTVENASDPGAGVTRVGDVLRYTVTLENAGAANSCLASAVVSDPLPAGLEPAAGTLRLSVGGGEPVAMPDAAYDAASRTIAVAVGDLWGGDSAVLTFQATVGEAALGSDIVNVAFSHGRVPSQSTEELPEAPDPGKPADPPAGDPAAKSGPASPAPVVGDDPEEGDAAIAKTAENTSRGDGTTHVGDTVRYEVTLRNEGAGTSWMDAVIRDDVPEGLEPVSGTIRLTLPDGSEAAVGDAAYDPESRVLAVAVGHLHGGQEAILAFDALVTEAAVGADIGNVAVGYGTPPSAWDPDAERPEPGAPFDPPGGWDSWEEGRGKVVSDPAYPPGTDKLGGVLPGDEGDRRRTTIAHKLAQTGDALATAAG